MADSADITKTTDLPPQQPRQPSPVQEQAARVESPVTDVRVDRPPLPPPSAAPTQAGVNIPSVRASDAVVEQMLAAPVSTVPQPGYADIEAVVTDIIKNATVNGYAVTLQGGNLDIQIPPKALVADRASESSPEGLPTSFPPPPSPPSPPTSATSETAPGLITPMTAANAAAAQTPPQPQGPQPGEQGFVYGRQENRREGEGYVDQVSREKREASGEAPEEEPFVYGRQENRREGESYVDQVSREKKGDTAPPPSASSPQGVYTEDRPEDLAAAEQMSNYVGNRRMGDYGRKENRREDESYSDQVTREHGEDRDERRRQREDRRAQRDRFDPMSGRRQRGETREEYRERKEKIESFDQKAQEALRNGDTTLLGKGYVPVLFTRADEQRKVLLRLDVTHSTVIEGAQGSERTGSLPAQNAYYLGGGGGGGGCFGLALEARTAEGSDPPTYELWVTPGTVAGQTPPDFTSDGKNIANGGSGDVWAEVNVNEETGEVVSVAVAGGSSMPDDTDTAFYYILGQYEFSGDDSPTVTNYGCGSVNATICRNWFAAEAPFFGVTLSR